MGPPGSWISEERRNRELAWVLGFSALVLLVPLAAHELYPFSSFRLFHDAPEACSDYSVTDPSGLPLDPRLFGLQRNYSGCSLREGYGRLKPPTLDEFGTIPAPEAVREHVARMLADSPFPHVDVTRKLIGPQRDGTVGVLETQTWRVVRPESPRR